jgi:hypothetical protein
MPLGSVSNVIQYPTADSHPLISSGPQPAASSMWSAVRNNHPLCFIARAGDLNSLAHLEL